MLKGIAAPLGSNGCSVLISGVIGLRIEVLKDGRLMEVLMLYIEIATKTLSQEVCTKVDKKWCRSTSRKFTRRLIAKKSEANFREIFHGIETTVIIRRADQSFDAFYDLHRLSLS
jgi:hypothetical protein